MLSVIMAGGVGERFWPRSRRKSPKQLINLTGQGSMIDLTVERVSANSSPQEIFILTNVDQQEAIARSVDGKVPRENIIGEPVGRNTAPSIGLAAIVIRHRFGDQPFMVLPADHIVGDLPKYNSAVKAAEDHVKEHGGLLTFGIKPTRPDTGYGYIEVGERLSNSDGVALYRAVSFQEKPDPVRAAKFFEQGTYYWNSGMFLWRPRDVLAAIESYLPDLNDVLAAIEKRLGTDDLASVLKLTYSQAPSISVDYGIMEKAENVAVVRGDFYWNDVGNWESIREVFSQDDQKNVLVGDHVLIDSSNNTVFSPDKPVAMVGLDDVVVVDGGDAILVCKRDRVQDVRRVVDKLKQKKKEEFI